MQEYADLLEDLVTLHLPQHNLQHHTMIPWCAGEEPHTGIIAAITDSKPSVVTCVEDERLQFQVLPGFGLAMVGAMLWGAGVAPSRGHRCED